jgi:hypothetical protein
LDLLANYGSEDSGFEFLREHNFGLNLKPNFKSDSLILYTYVLLTGGNTTLVNVLGSDLIGEIALDAFLRLRISLAMVVGH